MVDADIVLPTDWLRRCLDALATADVAGGIAVPDGDVAYLYRRFGLSPKVRAAATAVAGSNTLYRRSVFDRVGFEGSLKDGEDVALSHALRSVGVRTVVVPDLVVRHEESKTLATSLRWMFQSGLGAARQLYRYREIRKPDLAFAGWLGACLVAWRIRAWRVAAAAVPLAYISAASGAHVAAAFEFQPSRAARFFGAIMLNAVMLGTYFAGRLVGLVSGMGKPGR